MILDILLAAFIILLMVGGWRSGFIRSFFGLVGVLVSFFLTKVLYLPVTKYLYTTPIYKTIADAIDENVQINLPELVPPEFTEALGVTDLVENFSVSVLGILTYVVLFLVIYLVLSILVKLLDGVFKLPVLNLINRFLGLALNGLKAILLCYLLAVVLQFLGAGILAESRILSGILASVPLLTALFF